MPARHDDVLAFRSQRTSARQLKNSAPFSSTIVDVDYTNSTVSDGPTPEKNSAPDDSRRSYPNLERIQPSRTVGVQSAGTEFQLGEAME